MLFLARVFHWRIILSLGPLHFTAGKHEGLGQLSLLSCPWDHHTKMMEPCSFASYSETILRKRQKKPKANSHIKFKQSKSTVCRNSWTEMKGNEACLTRGCSVGMLQLRSFQPLPALLLRTLSSNPMSSVCTFGGGWEFRESWFLLQSSSTFGCSSNSELSLICCLLPQAEMSLTPLHKIIACYNHFAKEKPRVALRWPFLPRSNHGWLNFNKVFTYNKVFSRDIMQRQR